MVPGPPTSAQLPGATVLVMSLMSSSSMVDVWPGLRVPATGCPVGAGGVRDVLNWLPDDMLTGSPSSIDVEDIYGCTGLRWMFGCAIESWPMTFMNWAGAGMT